MNCVSARSNRRLSRITAEAHIATSHSNHSRLIGPIHLLQARTGTSDKAPVHLLQLGPQNHSTAVESQPNHSHIAPETKPNHSHITAASQPNHSHMTGTQEPNPLISNSENSPIHVFQILTHRRSVYFRITAESQPNHFYIRTGSQPLRNRRSACFRLGRQPNHSHIKPESEPLRVRQSACFVL